MERDAGMSAEKTFRYGVLVRVKEPGKRAFVGKVYSEYRDGPRGQRRICVEHPDGAGIAYLVRYVTLTKESTSVRPA